MTQQLKIGAYAVLVICAIWFGFGFVRNLAAVNASQDTNAGGTNEVSAVATNQSDAATNDLAGEESALTNKSTTATSSNSATAVARSKKRSNPASAPASRGSRTAAAMTYGAGLFAVILCLGLLVAHDVSRFAAHRFEKLIFDEDLEGAKDPEYDEAEKVWANGDHLQAIQLM